MKHLCVVFLLLASVVWAEGPAEVNGFDWQDWPEGAKVNFVVGFLCGTVWGALTVTAEIEMDAKLTNASLSTTVPGTRDRFLARIPTLTVGDIVQALDAYYNEDYKRLKEEVGYALLFDIFPEFE